MKSAVLEIPQSWNRYEYVISNPLVLVDPNGEDWYRSDADGMLYWFEGSDIRAGYKSVDVGANGLRLTNVKGSGRFAGFSGRNITLNRNGTVTDNGPYIPPPPAELPDKSGEVGMVLLQFTLIGIQGGLIVASGGTAAPLLLNTTALAAFVFLKEGPEQAAEQAAVSGATRKVDAGSVTVEEALAAAEKWLGKDYEQIDRDVYRSKDGSRQFRMRTGDLTDPRQGPHVHFEYIGPNGKQIIENAHLRLRGKP